MKNRNEGKRKYRRKWKEKEDINREEQLGEANEVEYWKQKKKGSKGGRKNMQEEIK